MVPKKYKVAEARLGKAKQALQSIANHQGESDPYDDFDELSFYRGCYYTLKTKAEIALKELKD